MKPPGSFSIITESNHLYVSLFLVVVALDNSYLVIFSGFLNTQAE